MDPTGDLDTVPTTPIEPYHSTTSLSDWDGAVPSRLYVALLRDLMVPENLMCTGPEINGASHASHSTGLFGEMQRE